MLVRQSIHQQSRVLLFSSSLIRFNSTVASKQTQQTVETTEHSSDFSPSTYKAPLNDVGTPNAKDLSQQAPNRIATWTASQAPRSEVFNKFARFQGKDWSKQPRPYSAMELINLQPIRYLEHEHIAVCDGNKGLQGHPRIYINLDQPKLNTCGYCGLRFARLEFKDLIEGSAK